MKSFWHTSFALFALATPVAGQDRLSPDQFLDFAVGRTIQFTVRGTDQVVGVEQFISRTRSVWVGSDQTCKTGLIAVEDGHLCFFYEQEIGNERHCWDVFTDAGNLLVRETDKLDAAILQVSEFDEDPLPCTNAPTS